MDRPIRGIEIQALVCQQAGGCPAASNFLLLRQKKVTKEKAPRWSGSPALRFGASCGARRKRGRARTRCAQTIARPDPFSAVLLGPARRVERRKTNTCSGRRGRAPRVLAGVRLRSRFRSRLHPFGCAEERRARRIRARDCLSRRRVRARPRLDRAPQVAPQRSEGDADSRVAFSLVTFFWRSKRKLLAAGQPPANRFRRTSTCGRSSTWIPDPVRDDRCLCGSGLRPCPTGRSVRYC